MNNRIYIDDFVEDLNYQGVILYIGNVDANALREVLTRDNVNKMYRFDQILNDENPAYKNFMYIENCDLQNLDFPVYDYMEDGYDIYVLYVDAGRYYVKPRIRK